MHQKFQRKSTLSCRSPRGGVEEMRASGNDRTSANAARATASSACLSTRAIEHGTSADCRVVISGGPEDRMLQLNRSPMALTAAAPRTPAPPPRAGPKPPPLAAVRRSTASSRSTGTRPAAAVPRDPQARYRGAALDRLRDRPRLERHRPRSRRLTGSRIVKFERVGPRLLMVQPNYQFRGTSSNAAERATSTTRSRGRCCGASRSPPRATDRVLVDFTDFLVRDANDIAGACGPGSYRFDAGAAPSTCR